MAYQQFEDLKVWQKAKDLSTAVFTQLAESPHLTIKEQLQKQAMNIMNNIAKGYERRGANDFERFLYIARGYCGELKSTLYLAEALQVISASQREGYFETVTDICKMLSGLIKKVNGSKDEDKH